MVVLFRVVCCVVCCCVFCRVCRVALLDVLLLVSLFCVSSWRVDHMRESCCVCVVSCSLMV